jgi:hypothetical protein
LLQTCQGLLEFLLSNCSPTYSPTCAATDKTWICKTPRKIHLVWSLFPKTFKCVEVNVDDENVVNTIETNGLVLFRPTSYSEGRLPQVLRKIQGCTDLLYLHVTGGTYVPRNELVSCLNSLVNLQCLHLH